MNLNLRSTRVTIRKIGNSEGVILPKDVLQSLGLKAGDELSLEIPAGGILLKKPEDAFEEQLALAEQFMSRYQTALKKLAE